MQWLSNQTVFATVTTSHGTIYGCSAYFYQPATSVGSSTEISVVAYAYSGDGNPAVKDVDIDEW